MRAILLVVGLLAAAGVGTFNTAALASPRPPLAVMDFEPSRPRALVYDGEQVFLDSRQSYVDAGREIVRTRWFVNGYRTVSTPTFVWNPEFQQGKQQKVSLEICDERGLCSQSSRVFLVSEVSRRFYYLKDHQGSVRATVDENGNVVHFSDYYPFGREMPRRILENESPEERFTGHQLDKGTGLMYAGARFYDPEIMRWTSPDPMSSEYPSWSPYNYSLNNPINNVDPDGRLVVFINGFYSDGLPFRKDLQDYWGDYAESVMSSYPGEDAYFADGSLGGIYGLSQVGRVFTRSYNFLPEDRYRVGYNAGWDRAGSIAARLEKDETVKIFSHSMGGAFGAGFASALQEAGLEVEFHLAIAPFQSTSIDIGGVRTFQVGDNLDPIAWYPAIYGATDIEKTRSNEPYSWMRFHHLPFRRHMLIDYNADSDVAGVQEELENDGKEAEKK
ncbi:MAG: RHS repeat-associated core domain-containing protein [Rhodothermales bacterium]|nr:RHS repeat-associated core domain-containing protein [Rhodothermales bacterium]